MVYAVISDLHANLSALRRVLADAKENGAQQIVCLGDVVGYGPLPAETVSLVRATAAVTLAGNHDAAVSGRLAAEDFIDLAGDAVKRHREALDADALSWLGSLPETCTLDGAVATHGDFTDPGAFNYVETEEDARANFETTDAPLAFVGHTHVPCLFVIGGSGTVYKTGPQDFLLEPGKRFIVNPGSVGYPREANGACHSSYVLYDSDEGSVRFRFLPFAVSSVMQRGTAPRRVRTRTIAALVAGVSLALGTGAYLLAPKTEVVNKVEVTVAEDPVLVLKRETLRLAPDAKTVSAGLALDRTKSPAQLTVVFRAATGAVLGRETDKVKIKNARGYRIPSGAVEAEFTVSKLDAADAPVVTAFAPSVR